MDRPQRVAAQVVEQQKQLRRGTSRTNLQRLIARATTLPPSTIPSQRRGHDTVPEAPGCLRTSGRTEWSLETNRRAADGKGQEPPADGARCSAGPAPPTRYRKSRR